MTGEALGKGLFAGAEKGAKYLANHPEQVETAYTILGQRPEALGP